MVMVKPAGMRLICWSVGAHQRPYMLEPGLHGIGKTGESGSVVEAAAHGRGDRLRGGRDWIGRVGPCRSSNTSRPVPRVRVSRLTCHASITYRARM
uniref:Uncharacterized protein n=1 Tax=Oryza sativa subsp. japonica TaxID=39947 RepID=Q5Z499_ORYSJ|nr:hypothetical protein [Oryza sativa Japonica Group]